MRGVIAAICTVSAEFVFKEGGRKVDEVVSCRDWGSGRRLDIGSGGIVWSGGAGEVRGGREEGGSVEC
jgi:hypothetical protein